MADRSESGQVFLLVSLLVVVLAGALHLVFVAAAAG